MRILMIGSFLSKRSGSYSVSENLALHLQTNQLDFILASRKENKVMRFLEVIFKSFLVRYDKMHIDIFSGPAFRIAETASIFAALKKKKIIITLHGGRLPEFYQSNQSRLMRLFKRASRIQTPSLYLKNFFQQQGIDVSYLPNTINLERFRYKRDHVLSHSLLWVRAFSSIYNPELAVKILAEVKQKYSDATLTMIGPDKGLLAKTKALIYDLKLNSSVKITGPISNDELNGYYQTHAVFLNTTSYESFGVAMAEAAACGIPIVSAQVGEIPYLYNHGTDILMVEGYDPKDFAQAVTTVFNSKQLADKLSINARKVAENFDWDKIKSKWIEILST